ncbi:uncharacterized protein LOC141851373 [Brevipalpus obovatus]|uniref:uncharacterized protein LOC141851373 n=1 Tax=Brevipalpus obovatus TaxID=246614 RepID=UPI003D9DBBC6
MNSTLTASNYCDQCKKNFSKKANLVQHCQRIHGLAKSHQLVLCALCRSEVEKKLFVEHCSVDHDLVINFQKLTFDSSQDFKNWKEKIEDETCAFFTPAFGKKYSENGYTQIFVCNRSGPFRSKSKGLRKMRSQGSRKSGEYCPARIKVSVQSGDHHSIDFCSSHIGHGKEPQHLDLPKEERKQLKERLEEGGERDPDEQLRDGDFMLVIMTPNQQKMLEKFGKKCVTIDSTHGVNNYAILLTTIMVLDEEGRETWALCYRKGLHVNTNMHLENMHRQVPGNPIIHDDKLFCPFNSQLKHIYMDGKKVKRLDKSIQSLMDMLRDYAHRRVIKIRKGYRSSKLFAINRSHDRSLKINQPLVECSDEEGKFWCIQSTTTGTDIYEIRKGDENCQCQLKCKACNICLHSMTCTCPDYFKGNLCKHLHYWKKSMQDESTQEGSSRDHDGELELSVITPSDRDEDVRDAVEDINAITRNSSLSIEKRELVDMISARIHSMKSSEDVRVVRESFENLFEENLPSSQEFIASEENSLKRKIEKQKRFYSIKKTRKSSSQGSARRTQNLSLNFSQPHHNPITTQTELINDS